MLRSQPYERVELLGRGGMGEVWKARHRGDGHLAALKLIRHGASASAAASIRHEAQAAARMAHPNIVHLYDYGVDLEGPWIAMELADGTLANRPPESWEELQEVLHEVLAALAYAHARGQLHRDLKPENVLVHQQDGDLCHKLADFGISHAMDAAARFTTNDVFAACAGSPPYMPPEQIEGLWRDFGPWSDLYALGCLAWSLAVGHPPFTGAPLDVMAQQMYEPLPPMTPRFSVPARLADWITALTRKEPHLRFQCAADAAHALASIRANDLVHPEHVPAGIRVTGESTRQFEATVTLPRRQTLTLTMTGDLQGATQPGAPAALFAATPSPAALGTGLVGLREMRFVGREREVDILSEALNRAHSGPTVVLLTGEAGVGTTRLGRWFGAQAEQIGAARSLETFGGPVPGPDSGLAGVVRVLFRCYGLDRARTRARIAAQLAAHGHPDPNREAIALGEIAHATERLSHTLGTREAFMSVTRALRTMNDRPWVLLIDDAYWARELVVFAQHLVEDSSLPILVLLTGRSTDAPRGLDQLERTALHIQLEPLPAEALSNAVEGLLALAPESHERLYDATAGNPLFARELLNEWVGTGALISTGQGLALADDRHPATLDELWAQRWRRIADSEPELATHVALLAAFGNHARESDLRAVGARLGFESCESSFAEATELGLLERLELGWRIRHRSLRHVIEVWASDGELWPSCHRAIVAHIREQGSVHPVTYRRLMRHLASCGELEEARALVPMAARQAFRYESPALAAQLLDEAQGLFERLECSEQSVERLQLRRYRAHAMSRSEQRQEALDILHAVFIEATAAGFHQEAAASMRGRAHILMQLGRVEEARQHVLGALDLLGHCDGSDQEFGHAYYILGGIELIGAHLEAADSALERAQHYFRAIGDESLVRLARQRQARIAVIRGARDEARRIFNGLMEELENTPDAFVERGVWTSLGDLARTEDDLAEATRCYNNALHLAQLAGRPELVIEARLNLALCGVAQGVYDEPEATFAEVSSWAIEHEANYYVPFALAGAAVCAAARGDLATAEDRFAAAVESIESTNLVDPEIVALCEQYAQLAAGTELGEHARAMATRQQQTLNGSRLRKHDQSH